MTRTYQGQTIFDAAMLRGRRHNLGYTLEDVEVYASISRSALCDYENGRSEPTLRVLCRLAQALDMHPGELLKDPR